MYSQIEKWVLSKMFGSRPELLGDASRIVDAVIQVEQDVVKLKNLQSGQTFSLPAMTESLFGITRTITITIGAP